LHTFPVSRVGFLRESSASGWSKDDEFCNETKKKEFYLVKSTINMLPEEVIGIRTLKKASQYISTNHIGGEQ